MITDILETIPEPTNSRYSCFDTGSLETEVGELIYGFVRAMKPERILETGSYHGISASYMADALKKNGSGKLITLEYEQLHVNITREQLSKLGLLSFVDVELISSLDYQPKENFDLMWIDTEPYLRFKEVIKYFPYLKQGGLMFIHDLHPHLSQIQIPNQEFAWPYGVLPEQIKNWLKDGELVKWHLRTPRGLTCFYKPGPDDYHAI